MTASLIIGLSFAFYLYLFNKANTKHSTTLDRCNLHRAGIRIVRRYSVNDSDLGYSEWNPGDPSSAEGEEFVSQRPSMN